MTAFDELAAIDAVLPDLRARAKAGTIGAMRLLKEIDAARAAAPDTGRAPELAPDLAVAAVVHLRSHIASAGEVRITRAEFEGFSVDAQEDRQGIQPALADDGETIVLRHIRADRGVPVS